MLNLENIPAVNHGDLKVGQCRLEITPLGQVSQLAEAWGLLPEVGEGVVVCADTISRFAPTKRSGLLLEADVADGRQTTVLRSVGQQWMAWRWVESEGDTHRYVEHTFLSSEQSKGADHIIYRQYWALQDDQGLKIWQPIGSRFCGFREAKS